MVAHSLVEGLGGELHALRLAFHNHQRGGVGTEDHRIAALVHAVHLDGILHCYPSGWNMQMCYEKVKRLLPDFLLGCQRDPSFAQRVKDEGLAFAYLSPEPLQRIIGHEIVFFAPTKIKNITFASLFQDMKKLLILFFGLMSGLFGCAPQSDSLVGEWKPDKVNVRFDESRTTPEMVRQTGELERQNRINISKDSLLVFKSQDTELCGRLTIDANGTLFCDGSLFGQWKEGQIITSTPSPLGEIVVSYRKE